MREANSVTELIIADEDIKKKNEASEKLRQEKLMEAVEKAKESRKRTREVSTENSTSSGAIGNAIMDRRDLIDRAIDGDDSGRDFFIPKASKKTWNKRVPNWRDVADHFSVYGFISTRKVFKVDLSVYSDAALKLKPGLLV
jgi:hypothetical protein